MELKLFINNEEKPFTVPFIKARAFRRALEIHKKVDFNNLTEEALDTVVDFVVEIFNAQFSRDEFYDGLSTSDLIPTINYVMDGVVGNGKANTEGK
jgi:hypothetical protein